MKFTIEKIIILCFFLATMALGSVMLIYYFNAKEINSTGNLVEHTQEVLRKSDEVLLDILNIDSGSRGYIITGNKNFLLPFNKAVLTLNSNIEGLAILSGTIPIQQTLIDSLKIVVKERLIYTKNIIEVSNLAGFNEAREIISRGKGEILNTNIKSIIADFNTEELRLLDLRKKENERIYKNSETIFLSLLIFNIIIFILVTILIIKNQKTRNTFEEELKKSTSLFFNLFNNNPASFAISRLSDDKIINVNNSFLELYGFNSREEVIGKTSDELNIYVNQSHTKEIAGLLKINTIVKDLETNIQTRSGEKKWIFASVLLMEIDNTPCLFSVAIEITNRKKAEEQLLAINNELETFTYSVSHDLKSPLRAINGYAKILQEDYSDKLDSDGITSLLAIRNNSKKMGELINDLLAFSRLGKKAVIASEINMTALANIVREEEMNEISREIKFKVHELLPAIGQQVLIKQVWVNLISNAIKYSQYKSDAAIEIGSYNKENEVVYYVKDNGVGFDMNYYKKLFGVFQRLHSQEEFEGTGIGLAIVQKIVNRHNGCVWAESKVNEGSCFYFSLPGINS